MTRQTAAPLDSLSLGTTNRQARELARLAHGGEMDVAPPYQRAPVWSLDQRIALVKSWMQGIPVPGIMINDRGGYAWRRANGESPLDTGVGIYAVVDGRQRVETAIAWFYGDLAVPASWFPADEVETTVETDDGPYVTFSGLTARGQMFTSTKFMLPMTEAKLATITDEADLYLLVNGGGTPQTEADLDRAASFSSEM